MVFQSWTLAWSASYQLQLKNGNAIKTSRYWEEGDEIKFYQYGGVVGVPRSNVIGIKSSDTKLEDYKEVLPTEANMKDLKIRDAIEKPMNNKEVKTDGSPDKDAPMDKTALVDASYYKSQKAALKEKLDDALERNREATRRKDQEAKDATRGVMREYVKKIYDLEDELKAKNKGVLPTWWNE
jgi:hypothetical protein